MKDKLVSISQCCECAHAYSSKVNARGCKMYGIRPKEYAQAIIGKKCPYKDENGSNSANNGVK